MKWIHKLNNGIEQIEEYLLILIVLVMVLLSFTQVVLRNILDEGILWGDTFLRHLVLWVGFIGASLATKEKKHINIDVLTRFMSRTKIRIADIIVNLFASFVSIYLANAGWNFVLEEKDFGTTLFADIPVWYFQIIIPIGFLLMGMRFLLLALESIVDGQEKAEVK